MKYALLFTACVLLTGCMGTFATRSGNQGIGAYPYQSIPADVGIVAETFQKDGTVGLRTTAVILGILSLPVDFIIDTIMLPVDLVAWPFGAKKGSTQFIP